jgi:WD40 repeat protein
MAPAELREAIEQPAFRVGCEVEPGLTERLLADVKGQAGALPLLQFALTEVWKKREVRRLTLQAYTELGKDDKGEQRGIEGVLEQRANEIYGSLKAEDQDLCRRIFLRLVQPGEGSEDTKRRVSYRELLPDDPTRAEAIKRLVRTLADRDARLVTTEGTDLTDGTVEVAHEALIRGWTQLRQWVDAERAGLRTQRRLTEQAQEWEAADKNKEDYLYSGARLAVAREWMETHGGELSRIEAAFLAVSEEAERQRKQDDVERERRLREAAEASKDAERRRAEEADARKQDAEAAARRQKKLGSRLLVAAVVAGVLAATSGGLALWANKARSDANKNANLAKENEDKANAAAELADLQRVAALSEAERNTHLDRAFLLAMEALRTRTTLETRNSLVRTFLARPRLGSFLHLEDSVTCVAFSPDGKTLAAGVSGSTSRLVLWDASQPQLREAVTLSVRGWPVTSVAFSPDGKTIAAGTAFVASGEILLWGRDEGKWRPAKRLEVRDGAVAGLAFSHDGKTIAAVSVGKKSGLVFCQSDKGTWQELQLLPVTEGLAISVAFRPEAKTLAVGYRKQGGVSGGVMLVSWDDAQHKWMTRKPDPITDGDVTSVAFSPDGKVLAAGVRGKKSRVMLWDVDQWTRLQPEPLAVPEGIVWSIAFSHDGKLAAGLDDAKIRGGVVLWDAAQWTRLQPGHLPVPEGRLKCIAFSPDGKTLATGLQILPKAGAVVLWDMRQSIRIRTELQHVPDLAIDGVVSSPDGKSQAKVATEAQAKTGSGVLLWDATKQTEQEAKLLPVSEGGISSIAFSHDSEILAAGFGSGDMPGGVVLWDVAERARIRPRALEVHEGGVSSIAFSRDNKTLAAGVRGRSGDGIVLWDVAGWTRLETKMLPVLEGSVSHVAFSPDGRLLAAGISASVRGNGAVIWDTTNRRRWITDPLPVPDGFVSSVSFSNDGKMLAIRYSSPPRGTFEVRWDLDLDSWIRLAGQIANRNLTRAEWREYFPDTPYRPTFDDLPVPPETNTARPE